MIREDVCSLNVVFNMICAWKSESQIIIAEKALAENWRLLG